LVLGSGAAVFFLHRYVQAIPMPVIQVLDAAGLALFAIAGTLKAMMHRKNWLVAVLLGTITGVGGGTIRDALLAQIPTVLRFEVYATAAPAGPVCMVVARRLRRSTNLAAAIGGTTRFLLRVISFMAALELAESA
jgi:uncharacterized membrane protein YeiH